MNETIEGAGVRRVIIDLGDGRRVVVYPQGGMDLETNVEGVGWVLDNDAEVNDSVIVGHLTGAIAWMKQQADKLGG